MSELITNAYNSSPAILTALPFYATAALLVWLLKPVHPRWFAWVIIAAVLVNALLYTFLQLLISFRPDLILSIYPLVTRFVITAEGYALLTAASWLLWSRRHDG